MAYVKHEDLCGAFKGKSPVKPGLTCPVLSPQPYDFKCNMSHR